MPAVVPPRRLYISTSSRQGQQKQDTVGIHYAQKSSNNAALCGTTDSQSCDSCDSQSWPSKACWTVSALDWTWLTLDVSWIRTRRLPNVWCHGDMFHSGLFPLYLFILGVLWPLWCFLLLWQWVEFISSRWKKFNLCQIDHMRNRKRREELRNGLVSLPLMVLPALQLSAQSSLVHTPNLNKWFLICQAMGWLSNLLTLFREKTTPRVLRCKKSSIHDVGDWGEMRPVTVDSLNAVSVTQLLHQTH